MEAGEKEDLLDKQEDTNKKDDQGDDLKEVKVDESGSPVKKDPDAASHDSSAEISNWSLMILSLTSFSKHSERLLGYSNQHKRLQLRPDPPDQETERSLEECQVQNTAPLCHPCLDC